MAWRPSRTLIIATALTAAAIIAVALWLASALGILGQVGGVRRIVSRQDALVMNLNVEVRRIDELTQANQILIAQVAALKTSQVAALREANVERCARMNATNAALIRILRTITRVIRRQTAFKRGSALRTYRRAFLRLRRVNCRALYAVPRAPPQLVAPLLTPAPPSKIP